MKHIPCLIMLMPILLNGARANVREDVDTLVAQLPAHAAESPAYMGEIPRAGPVAALIKLGMDAVPYLVPHLANTGMTKSFRVHGNGRKWQISVNEFVGYAITRICGHNFYIASGDMVVERLGDKPITNPDTIAWYQEQVKMWHSSNGHLIESKRKLSDIDDWFFTNRLNAYKFFLENPTPQAREMLRARMQFLLAKPEHSSMKISELISCSEAIASIGDATDLDLIKKTWLELYERPMRHSNREYDVKRFYRSRVKLGDKDQAKKDIDAYYQKHSGEFPPIIVE